MIHSDLTSKNTAQLTLDAQTLANAQALGMDVSKVVDELLQKEVQRRTISKWASENEATVAAYNRRVNEQGLWNADLRKMRGQI